MVRAISEEEKARYLDKTVCGVPVVEVRHSKLLALPQLPYLHREEGDCSFLVLFVRHIELFGSGIDIYRRYWRGQEVEEVAKRDTEGETVPELRDGIGRLSRRTRRGCKDKVGLEVFNA